MGKRIGFSKNGAGVAEYLKDPVQKNEFRFLPHNIWKVNTELVKDINGRAEIPKCQKNVNIDDLELIKSLLDMIPNSEVTEEKNKLDFIKLKTFV